MSTKARFVVGLWGVSLFAGCGASPPPFNLDGGIAETGGATATGGMTSAGGSAGTGGATATGGAGGTTTGDCGGASMGGAGEASANPITWRTSTVSLTAADFWIIADGQRYTSNGATVDVHSDPGDPTYTSLELVWMEHGREMRFFTYFYAPDTTAWFSNEMRTYDGQATPDWLFYKGMFFKSPIGAPFHGDLDLMNDPSDALRGELHLHGVTLSTTLTGICPAGGCLGSGQ